MEKYLCIKSNPVSFVAKDTGALIEGYSNAFLTPNKHGGFDVVSVFTKAPLPFVLGDLVSGRVLYNKYGKAVSFEGEKEAVYNVEEIFA